MAYLPPLPICQDGDTILVPGSQLVARRARGGGAWSDVTVPAGTVWSAIWELSSPLSLTAKDQGPLVWLIDGWTGDGPTVWTVGESENMAVTVDPRWDNGGVPSGSFLVFERNGTRWYAIDPDSAFRLFCNTDGFQGSFAIPDGPDDAMFAGAVMVTRDPSAADTATLVLRRTFTPISTLTTLATDAHDSAWRFHAIGDGTINGSWVAWINRSDEVKLYRRSNVTTYTNTVPTGTTDGDGAVSSSPAQLAG